MMLLGSRSRWITAGAAPMQVLQDRQRVAEEPHDLRLEDLRVGRPGGEELLERAGLAEPLAVTGPVRGAEPALAEQGLDLVPVANDRAGFQPLPLAHVVREGQAKSFVFRESRGAASGRGRSAPGNGLMGPGAITHV